MMPELDGFGVLQAMQADPGLRQVPVIVLTGQTLSQEDMQRMSRGVAAVLSKGVHNLDEVLQSMVSALDRTTQSGAEQRRLGRRAVAYIHEHYPEPIDRKGIAAFLGVSGDYFARCFHAETGLTFSTYLRRYRLQRARQLLIEGTMNITEVALAAGFSDSNYFTRLFRQELGVPPSVYRRS
jgi:two-component system response regulator YesN